MSGIERFEAAPGGRPSAAMRAAYQRDGFLVVDRFADPRTCAALRQQARSWVEALDLPLAPSGATVFSTRSHAHARDDAFERSANEIRCFLEEDALDEHGALTCPKAHAVNKAGHAIHDLDPVFSRFSRSGAVEALVRGLGAVSPLLLQSMVLYKPPRIGGEVVWHQDAAFLLTDPPSVTGLWLALEDAGEDNGTLRVAPGAHRGPLRRRFVRREGELVFEELDPTPWPVDESMPIAAPAGTLVVLHAMAPHASEPNRSSRSRMAYSLHLIERSARYLPECWLQRAPQCPLRGFER